MLAHDLRSPLQAITSWANVFELHDDTEIRETGARIANSAQRMGEMLADLSDFTRGRFGARLALDLAPVEVPALLKTVLQELAGNEAAERLDASVPEDLPPARWDPVRVAQLVSNVVGNALKHSPAGTPVRFRVRAREREFELQVENEGSLALPGPLDELFQPFVRGEAPGAPGLGLGLYVAERVARAHGGRIRIASEAERVTVTVSLPADAG